jgi:flagellar L-ring protein precursor FlgH
MAIRAVSRISLLAATTLCLGACGSMDRISKIGEAPELTRIENPVAQADYKPVSFPMPTPRATIQQPNSLWDGSRQTFFKDQRAAQVGDIITVLIDVKDKAQIDNESKRSRASSENAGVDNLLGLETGLAQYLPEAIDNTSLAKLGSDSNHTGKGSVDREEKITLKMAAVVTQKLPNGNMVLHGRQEIRVNFEKRILGLDGVIRPEDISVDNTISYEKIAEARIAYGGEGQISDFQQPRYGQQLYDIVFPF